MTRSTTLLAERYDTFLFDLDGVVYLGPAPVPTAPDTLQRLRDRNGHVAFVTNNASRTPEAVAAHLGELGIAAGAADVVTSAQAVAHLLAERFRPGTRALVLGTEALTAELTAQAGLEIVGTAADEPAVVVQGLSPTMTWHDLCEAAAAIHRGAAWYVTNTDTTRPTDQGLLPGCGAAVAALATAVEAQPTVAGKPYPPLLRETLARVGGDRPLFIGDRLDTDIAGAAGVGIDSMLVLSGAHGAPELLAAGPSERPTHLGLDVADLLMPARAVSRDDTARRHTRCGDQQITLDDHGAYGWRGTIRTAADWVDAVWALVHLHWDQPQPEAVDPQPILTAIGPIPQEPR